MAGFDHLNENQPGSSLAQLRMGESGDPACILWLRPGIHACGQTYGRRRKAKILQTSMGKHSDTTKTGANSMAMAGSTFHTTFPTQSQEHMRVQRMHSLNYQRTQTSQGSKKWNCGEHAECKRCNMTSNTPNKQSLGDNIFGTAFVPTRDEQKDNQAPKQMAEACMAGWLWKGG